MKHVRLIIAVIVLGLTVSVSSLRAAPFLETYPDLKKHLFEEPKTKFYFGFGVSPVGVMENRMLFAANVFQVHWIAEPYFDIEVLSASVGLSTSKGDYSGSRTFLFRFAPKLRPVQYLSVGPVFGYEMVSFPDVEVRLMKGGLFTPIEPFSSRGFIIGVTASQTFEVGGGYLLKINESVYKETYSTTDTNYDWQYVYMDTDLQNDSEHSLVKPSMVFALEVSLLF